MFDTILVLALLRFGLAAAAAALLLSASFNDVAVRTIPNLLSLGIAVIGAMLRLIDGTLMIGLAASAAVLALGALCWRCGWLGGGDAKLMSACALLARPVEVSQFVVATALAGGVLACLYLALGRLARSWHGPVRSGRSHTLLVRVCRVEWWRARQHPSLPYGCAIASAAMFALLAN
jgi:prepilin peptidase CpaA